MMSALKRNWLRLLLAFAMVGVVGVIVTVVGTHRSPKPVARAHPIHVAIASGCPASIQGIDGVENKPKRELSKKLVPPGYSRLLVCRYSELADSPDRRAGEGVLTKSVNLTVQESARIVRRLDAIPSAPAMKHGCLHSTETRNDLLVFAYPGGTDLDLWFARAGCTTIDNGYVVRERITPLIIAAFDALEHDLDRAAPVPAVK
jgi:hypothetical protein